MAKRRTYRTKLNLQSLNFRNTSKIILICRKLIFSQG